jgi:FixJ family two-component response regulator
MKLDDTATVYFVAECLDRDQLLLESVAGAGYKIVQCDVEEMMRNQGALDRPCVVVIELRAAQKIGWLGTSDTVPVRFAIPVILISDRCDAMDAMEHGALTIQVQPISIPKVLDYIRVAARQDKADHRIHSRYIETKHALDIMTTRQRTILAMVAEGKTTKQIAMLLDVSVRLVEQERSTILRQFRVLSTPEVTVKIGEFRALRLMHANGRDSAVTENDPMNIFLDQF